MKAIRVIAISLFLVGSLLSTATAQTDLAVAYTFWEVKQVVDQASPSVVGIVATLPPLRKDAAPERAVGTGLVYRADGYIITNAHIVHGATEVLVLLPGGRVATPAMTDVWTDHLSDIAVIRISGVTPKAAVFADSDQVRVGQIAVAIGNPLGLRLHNSVSVGVISGKGRLLGTGYPFLQTDAAINAGSSGGPLLNSNGQVVGINTVKLTAQSLERLAFTIPSNVVKEVADSLIREGMVVRPWLGLFMEESDLASVGLPTDEGLMVYAVAEGGPAAAVIRVGDVVTALDGRKVSTLDDVAVILAAYRLGEQVAVAVKRENNLRAIWVELAQMPNDPQLGLFGDDVAAPGPWQFLTEKQAAAAVEHGTENADKSFDSFTRDYVQKGEKVAVYLETEFMHLAYLHWNGARANQPLSEGAHAEAMRRIRGKLEVKIGFMLRHGSWSSPTVMITHGGKTVNGSELSNVFRERLFPNASGGPGVRIYTPIYRFDVGQLDPAEPLLIRVRGPEGVDESFEYDLRTLR